MAAGLEKLIRFLDALKVSQSVDGRDHSHLSEGGGSYAFGQAVRSISSTTEQILEQTAAVASSLTLQGQSLLSGGKKDDGAGKRERMTHCQTVADTVIAAASGSSRTPDATKTLNIGLETLLLLADDESPDVRMMADEALNRIVRGVSPAQVAKVLVEQIKDKLNGPQRILRAALTRFAVIAKHIRVQKGRAYTQTLVPLLRRLTERSEESLHESIATSLNTICSALGHFFTESEIKVLLLAFQQNLSHESAVVRRCAAQSLCALCKHTRKPGIFTGCLIVLLLKGLLPISLNHSRNQILGYLGCLRQLSPELQSLCPPSTETKSSTNPYTCQPYSVTVEQLLQVYQLALHYSCSLTCNEKGSIDHNIVTSGLELLKSLLEHAPAALITALVTPGGVARSFIDAAVPVRTPSCGSLSGLLSGEEHGIGPDTLHASAVFLQEDPLLENEDKGVITKSGLPSRQESLEEFPVQSCSLPESTESVPVETCAMPESAEGVPVQSSTLPESTESLDHKGAENKSEEISLHCEGNLPSETQNVANKTVLPLSSDDLYSSIEIGKLSEEGENIGIATPKSEKLFEVSTIDLISDYERAQAAHPQEETEAAHLQQESEAAYLQEGELDEVVTADDIQLVSPKGNLGASCGATTVAGRYAIRSLCARFLLAGHSGSLLGERAIRVSSKVLVLSCLSRLFTWLPEVMEQTLYVQEDFASKRSGDDELVQHVYDVCRYSSHTDPTVTAAAASMIGHYLRSVVLNGASSTKLPISLRQRSNHTDKTDVQDVRSQSSTESVNFMPLSVVSLLEHLETIIESPSSVAVRGALAGLRTCLPVLFSSFCQTPLLNVLSKLISLVDHSYWLVKVDLCELLSELPLTNIDFMERNQRGQRDDDLAVANLFASSEGQFSYRILNEGLMPLLADEDQRVRNASINSIITLVPELCLEGDLFCARFDSLCLSGSLVSSPTNYCDHYNITPGPLPPFDELISQFRLREKRQKLHRQILTDTFLSSHHGSPGVEDNVHRSDTAHSEFIDILKLNDLSSHSLRNSLSNVVRLLSDTLFTTTDRYMKIGCLQALCQLSQSYSPVLYPEAWDCCASPSARSAAGPPCLGIVESSLSVMTDPSLSSDLATVSACTTVACQLLAGVGVATLMQQQKFPASPRRTMPAFGLLGALNARKMGFRVLAHLARILQVYWHVIEDVSPNNKSVSAPNSSTQFQSSAAENTSPAKRPVCTEALNTEAAQQASGADNRSVGDGEKDKKKSNASKLTSPAYNFTHLPHYMKLYEVVRNAYCNYKMTVCVLSEQRLTNVLRSALSGLCVFLEVLHTADILAVLEQLLICCTTATQLLPQPAILTAQQLIKCLFGCNVADQWHDLFPKSVFQGEEASTASCPKTTPPSVFTCAVHLPLQQLREDILQVQFGISSGNSCSPERWPKRITHHRLPPTLRSALSSYIRMFEPIVIKSLNLYTVSNNVFLQKSVLELLVCLVHIRVNYCLLDSNQIFLRYVIKQLEHIEEGHIFKADVIMPAIFGFLVAVSYERQQNRNIITVPKILQLCDGLLASGHPPLSHCVLALGPLVEEIFLNSTDYDSAAAGLQHLALNTPEFAELSTKQEVLASTVYRLANFHQAVRLMGVILQAAQAQGTSRWLQVSKDVLATLCPLMATQQLNLYSAESVMVLLDVLCALSPGVFDPPPDELLRVLLGSPSVLESTRGVIVWVAGIVVALRVIITRCSARSVLRRLSELGLSVLNTSSESCQAPQTGFSEDKTTEVASVLNLSPTLSNFSPIRRKFFGDVRNSSVSHQSLDRTNPVTQQASHNFSSGSLTTSTPATFDPLNATQPSVEPSEAVARFLLEVLLVCCSEIRSVWYQRRQTGRYDESSRSGDCEERTGHILVEEEALLVRLGHQLLLLIIWMIKHESWSPVSVAVRAAVSAQLDSVSLGPSTVMAEISESVLSVRSAHPSLALLCAHVHELLDLPGLHLWPQLLRSSSCRKGISGVSSAGSLVVGSTEKFSVATIFNGAICDDDGTGSSNCLSLQYARQSALLLFVPYVCAHLREEDWLAWVLMQHAGDVLTMSQLPAIRTLLHAVYGSAAASALLLNALATRQPRYLSEAQFGRSLLEVVSKVHTSQSGTLVLFLLEKMLLQPYFLHVSSSVCTVLKLRLQLLLAPGVRDLLKQVTLEHLQPFVAGGRHARTVQNRWPELSYDLHQLLGRIEDGVNENCLPSYVVPSKSNNAWFIGLVERRCARTERGTAEECCELLLQVHSEQNLLAIMSSENFNLQLLQHTFLYGYHASLLPKSADCCAVQSSQSSPNGSSTSTSSVSSGTTSSCSLEGIRGKTSEHSLYSVSKQVLLQHVEQLVALYPRPHYDFRPEGGNKYSDKILQIFLGSLSLRRENELMLLQLMPAVTCYLRTSPLLHSKHLFSNDQLITLLHFATLCAHWLQLRLHQRSCCVHTITLCLSMHAAVLQYPAFLAYLALPEHNSFVCSLVGVLHAAVESLIAPSKLISLPDAVTLSIMAVHSNVCASGGAGGGIVGGSGVGLAAGRLMQLITWLESPGNFSPVPPNAAAVIGELIMGLSRWPAVNGILRCPPVLWSMDWEPSLQCLALCPPIPSPLLHEPFVLKQYIFRSQLLGWLSRQQFEETWMALLSVLSDCTAANNQNEEQDLIYRDQVICLCLRGLCGLLCQTMLLPTPGNPHMACKAASDHLNYYETDNALQRVLHVLYSRQEIVKHMTHAPPHPALLPLTPSPPSVYILAAAFVTPDSPPSPSDAPEYARKLADMGIDLTSCTHFLLDLFAAWFTVESGLSSSVICEMSRCLRWLVPVLNSSEQQVWLARTCVALHAVHPLDDHHTHAHLIAATSHSLAVCRAAQLDVWSPTIDGVTQMMEWGLATSSNIGVRTATLKAATLLLLPSPAHALQQASQAQKYTASSGRRSPQNIQQLPKAETGTAKRLLQGTTALPRGALNALSFHIKSSSAPMPDTRRDSTGCVDVVLQQDMFLSNVLNAVSQYCLKACDSAAAMGGVLECSAHMSAVWSLCSLLMERYSAQVSETLPPATMLQLALASAAAPTTSYAIRKQVLQLVVNLVRARHSSIVTGSATQVVLKFAIDLVQRGSPHTSLCALPLLLHLLYMSRGMASEEEPEQLLQLLERVSAFMERIRSGLPHEAWLLSGLLGPCLLDLLPASQSLNKVIMEYISSHQPRPQLLAHTLFQIFEGCVREGGEALVQEWVLMSLGNFTRREPVSLAVWCLTCFMVAASRCSSLRAAYPSVRCWPDCLSRLAVYSPATAALLRPEQLELFKLAAAQFEASLPSPSHKQKFRAVFADVDIPGSPFHALLRFLDHDDRS